MALEVKNLPANAEDMRRRFDPWVGKIPWRRAWQPTSVFLPGESHGQRSLAEYSPWGQTGWWNYRRRSGLPAVLCFSNEAPKPKEASLFRQPKPTLWVGLFILKFTSVCVHAKLLQLCPAICNLMDCSPPGSSVHGILQARILELGCHALLQRIFVTLGSNPRLLWLLHCRCILLPLSHLEAQSSTEVMLIAERERERVGLLMRQRCLALLAGRGKWQPTPIFLPGESCGQRSLVGCCPWGRTGLDTTEETYQGYMH